MAEDIETHDNYHQSSNIYLQFYITTINTGSTINSYYLTPMSKYSSLLTKQHDYLYQLISLQNATYYPTYWVLNEPSFYRKITVSVATLFDQPLLKLSPSISHELIINTTTETFKHKIDNYLLVHDI